MAAMLFIVYNTFEFKVFVASIRVGPIVDSPSPPITTAPPSFFSCPFERLTYVLEVQIPLALIGRGAN